MSPLPSSSIRRSVGTDQVYPRARRGRPSRARSAVAEPARAPAEANSASPAIRNAPETTTSSGQATSDGRCAVSIGRRASRWLAPDRRAGRPGAAPCRRRQRPLGRGAALAPWSATRRDRGGRARPGRADGAAAARRRGRPLAEARRRRDDGARRSRPRVRRSRRRHSACAQPDRIPDRRAPPSSPRPKLGKIDGADAMTRSPARPERRQPDGERPAEARRATSRRRPTNRRHPPRRSRAASSWVSA